MSEQWPPGGSSDQPPGSGPGSPDHPTSPWQNPPSPFSREGSSAADELASADPTADPYYSPGPPTANSQTPNPQAPNAQAPYPQAPYPQQPPPDTGPSPRWPSYPGASEHQFGYDPTGIPSYGGPAPLPPPSHPAEAYQPAYGSNPYLQQPYAYGYVPTNHPQSIIALVLGITGLALCPFVGVAAFFVGAKARKEIDAQPGRWVGRGAATAGWILGMVSIAYSALWVLVIILGFSGNLD